MSITLDSQFTPEIRNIASGDILTTSDRHDLCVSVGRHVKRSKADTAVGMLLLASFLPEEMLNYSNQIAPANDFGVSTSAISQGLKTGRVFEAVATGETTDVVTPEHVANILQFGMLSGLLDGQIREMAANVRSESGADRWDALTRWHAVYGSVLNTYNVANGVKFHEDDERNVTPDNEPTPDDEPTPTPDDDDSPKVSGEELIARGIRKMRENGASDADITAFVMATMG